MQPAKGKWRYSLLYLFFILLFLFLLHSLIPDRFLFLNETVRIQRKPDLPLRFRSDGTFKILQVADMHYGNGAMTRCRDVLESEFNYCSDLNTTNFLKRMIETEDPDFIAFTGDNIFGSSATDAAESLLKVFVPVIESKLPWAAVLGNHDQESTMTRGELMSFISLMDYSVSRAYPSIDKVEEKTIDGFGNYNIKIHGPPGSHLANSTVLNMYFLDSGDRATVNGIRTYSWIKESQLRWLSGVSKEFQEINQDFSTPSMAFFHIAIPEVRQLFYKKIIGQFQEAVACSIVNPGVLQTLISMGDVKAVFIGHDHTNDFCGDLEGIWFCYGGGFGYHGYGRAGWARRARIVVSKLGKGESSWSGVERIETWKRLDDQKLTKIDEQVLWEYDSKRG